MGMRMSKCVCVCVCVNRGVYGDSREGVRVCVCVCVCTFLRVHHLDLEKFELGIALKITQ